MCMCVCVCRYSKSHSTQLKVEISEMESKAPHNQYYKSLAKGSHFSENPLFEFFSIKLQNCVSIK